jgi:hypothetical protein
VRIVLDMKGKVTYKVRNEGNKVSLIVATPNDPEFPFWCAQPLSESEKLQLALSGKTDSPPDKGTRTTPNENTEKSPSLVSSKVSDNPDDGPKIPSWVRYNTEGAEQGSDKKASEGPRLEIDDDMPLVINYEESELASNILSAVDDPQSDDDSKADKSSDRRPAVMPSKKADNAPNNGQTPSGRDLVDSSVGTESVTPGVAPSRENEPGESPKPNVPTDDGSGGADNKFQTNPSAPTKNSGILAERFPKRKVVEYQSWGKPDPFAALIDKGRGRDLDDPPDVETLRLIGVLKANDQTSALLEDLDGYGYILKDGDPVRNGYVVQIGENKVIFQISEYGWSRTVALKMETDD